MARKIIHLDCDCFFAAVEMRDDPLLVGRPVAVGGDPGKRGVVATCNYEARQSGVHSAMPSAVARRLCPDLILIPPDMAKYRAVSQQVRDIFFDYTERVEPLSLDEAFLDVTDSERCRGSATLIAEAIRRRVREELAITISAGVAPNKFLAKIASDWRKPDGLFVIRPEAVADFMIALPVTRLSGVGRATASKLQRLGVETCGDVQTHTVFELVEHFGKLGRRLHELAHGIDERPVKVARQRQSLSVEETYAHDLADARAVKAELPPLLLKLMTRLRRVEAHYRQTKVFVKLRFDDFSTTTHEQLSSRLGLPELERLIDVAWERGQRPVRLVGIGVRFVDLRDEVPGNQLSLFEVASDLSQA